MFGLGLGDSYSANGFSGSGYWYLIAMLAAALIALMGDRTQLLPKHRQQAIIAIAFLALYCTVVYYIAAASLVMYNMPEVPNFGMDFTVSIGLGIILAFIVTVFLGLIPGMFITVPSKGSNKPLNTNDQGTDKPTSGDEH